MANPWDRRPRTARLPEATELACPACGRPTDSLKQYRYVSRVIFYLIGTYWQTAYYRACPSCMRKLIARRAAWNFIPANLLWFVSVLPWGLGLVVATYQKGHSPDVLRQVTPRLAASRDDEARRREGRAAVAIWALLLCWVPLLGLGVALGAWLVNRKADDWKRPVSRIAFILSVLVTLTLLVLLVVKG